MKRAFGRLVGWFGLVSLGDVEIHEGKLRSLQRWWDKLAHERIKKVPKNRTDKDVLSEFSGM